MLPCNSHHADSSFEHALDSLLPPPTFCQANQLLHMHTEELYQWMSSLNNFMTLQAVVQEHIFSQGPLILPPSVVTPQSLHAVNTQSFQHPMPIARPSLFCLPKWPRLSYLEDRSDTQKEKKIQPRILRNHINNCKAGLLPREQRKKTLRIQILPARSVSNHRALPVQVWGAGVQGAL